MGKFDDYKQEADQYEEDIYGDDDLDSYEKSQQLARLNQKVQVQQKVQTKTPEYIKQTEKEKTMDLMFFNGVLHQKIIYSHYTVEVNSGESVLNGKEDKWEKIESKTVKDADVIL